jgi:uncharacterized protein (DUF983 family)
MFNIRAARIRAIAGRNSPNPEAKSQVVLRQVSIAARVASTDRAMFQDRDIRRPARPYSPCRSRHVPVIGCRIMNQSSSGAGGQPTILQSALRGIACKCPRCGQGRLFSGFLTLRPRCEVCGLDYAFIDSGDGPAVFIVLIAGAIVVAAALIVEVKYQPPLWVHAALWLPLTLMVTLWPLRAMKSLLTALQFHHKAAPGRLIDRAPK